MTLELVSARSTTGAYEGWFVKEEEGLELKTRCASLLSSNLDLYVSTGGTLARLIRSIHIV